MFMRNRYNILFSLFWASLVLVGIETQAQENLKFAPNDIPVPWYSQKITGCPYTHCSLASSNGIRLFQRHDSRGATNLFGCGKETD